MKLEIRFRHMDRSEALENLVTEKVMQAMDGFLNRHDAHIQVWLVSDLNRTTRGAGSFICEIDVRYPRRKHCFIRKAHPDMHSAVQEAAEKLHIFVTEAGKKEIEDRHSSPTTRQMAAADRLQEEATELYSEMAAAVPIELIG